MNISTQLESQEFETLFSDIFSAYEAPLSGFIAARVSNENDAEDILQDVWFQLSRTFGQTEIEHVSGWLYQVARRKIIDHYRKHSPELLDDYLLQDDTDASPSQELPQENHENPETALLQEQFWDTWYQALDALPAAQREVFLLNEWEGITLREIAERTGENLKTIISRKRYAVLRLRDALQEIFEAFTEA